MLSKTLLKGPLLGGASPRAVASLGAGQLDAATTPPS